MNNVTFNSAIHHNTIGAASFWVPNRRDDPELLDMGVGTLADVRANLDEMWRLNRLLGGLAALTRHLFPRLLHAGRPLRLVDVGAGSGAMAAHIARWAARRSISVEIIALDLSGRNLAAAQQGAPLAHNVHLLQADVHALPFAPGEVDYYYSSLFLHHFSPDAITALLHHLFGYARCGLMMSDLVRGYLPRAAFRLIEPVFARHYLTRHDGRISIERAYTPPELLTLAKAARLEQAQVYHHVPWRMTLVAEKAHV